MAYLKRRLLTFALFSLSLLALIQEQDKEAALRQRAQELQKAVTKTRDLSFKADVKASFYTKDQLRRFLKEEYDRDLPDDEARLYQKAVAKFGLVPKDLDVKQAMLELMTEQIAGFYHPRTKELFLIKGDQEGKKEKEEEELIDQALGVKMSDVLLVHELTHAAQDQHFHIRSVPIQVRDNDDLSLALRCLIEGEATLVMWQYGLKEKFKLAKDRMGDVMGEGAKTGKAAKLPLYLTQQLFFPYSSGYDFILKVKEHDEESGWESITKMYQELPSSTKQILHPEKYFEKRAAPILVFLAFPELKKALGDGWKFLHANVFGELGVRIMLKQYKLSQGDKTAAGWGGDRFCAYENKNGKIFGIWYTTWDTEKEAGKFFKAYQKLISKKYKQALRREAKEEDKARVVWDDSDGSLIVVEQRQCDVLIMEGMPPEKSEGVQKLLWEKTEKEALREVKRLKEY